MKMKQVQLFIASVVIALLTNISGAVAAEKTVGKYRLFEKELINKKTYNNKFVDVELLVDYISPSGKKWPFWGFFDGDGKGKGNKQQGNIWKMRFMPDEVGVWTYQYRWSDGTKGGNGTFISTEKNAGKGIIKPYEKNPHWFAYNGTDPVWLKSYYETGHGAIAQDFDWMTDNVFQPLIDNGYNHLQVNWLLSMCCYTQYYLDGPKPSTLDLTLYKAGEITSTMDLNVWKLMEKRVDWLNHKDIGIHMFIGFDGSKNNGPRWEDLSEEEKVFYVKYVIARLGAFANIAGWNLVWEIDGGRETHGLGWAKLVKKYDIFDHLRTYQDEMPRDNHFSEDAYNFAAVENHLIVAPDKSLERYNYWRTAWTHYMASILGYVGKPVYMMEGNSLWQRYWHPRSGATQDDLRQAAWATTMAAASFNWNGAESEKGLYAKGPYGLPIYKENPFYASSRYIDLIERVMNEEVQFYKLTPQSDQLTRHDPFRVFALIEEGQQYVVYSIKGEPFSLFLSEGTYNNNVWINTKTGEKQPATAVTGLGSLLIIPKGYKSREEWPQSVSFTPPSNNTDWLLIVRK
ncbi:MAG: DUF5060 domain-containing protein [Paraglaciecola sp.]|uniref:DUF5060 domain-containing protein n=1 Tax=Paraglaciecola sp. TaxID=1920173 RepID=UPI003299E4B3